MLQEVIDLDLKAVIHFLLEENIDLPEEIYYIKESSALLPHYLWDKYKLYHIEVELLFSSHILEPTYTGIYLLIK